jgi:hypothetical protein
VNAVKNPSPLRRFWRSEELEEFRQWTESRGLRIASTRLREYIASFRTYKAIGRFGDLSREEADRCVFLIREMGELIWVYDGLKLAQPPGVLAVLEKALGGAAIAREENATAPARNFLYELRIASFFLQAGFHVDLSTDSDLCISLSRGKLHVECKRISSLKKARIRSKEALKQLRRRISTDRAGRRAFGLACLEVSRALHPNQGMTSAPTANQVKFGLQQQLMRFDLEYRLGDVFKSDKDILAVWLQMSVPTVSPDGILPRFSSLVVPLAPTAGPRKVAFEELRRVFEWE